MPPRFISEVTNPVSETATTPDQSRRFIGKLITRESRSKPEFVDIDMNVAETYGIDWDRDKCGRDAFQNFFDANGGTMDGVRSYLEEIPDDSESTHAVSIEGDHNYDYRELTVIGATTKTTGEHTAGGFGEGAKFLALSLLRDHDVDRVIYRSRDWQLEFFIGDMDEDRVARPTRGLFARVATGLEYVEGSATTIMSKNQETAQALVDARQFFRSSENPDFQDNVIEKTLPDGTEIGVKFMGVTADGYYPRTENGHLYVAGQRRHYSAYGSKPDSWDTVAGVSIWTTKDVAAGDRDRGAISKSTLKDEVFTPLAQILEPEEIETFFTAIEPAYTGALSGTLTELGTLGELIAKRGKELEVKLEFDPKYVSVSGLLPRELEESIKSAGYEICPGYYANVGMRTHTELLRSLHEHQRIEPSPEQQVRIDLLQEGLDAMAETEVLEKQIESKEIWLFSKELEKNPFEGTYDEEFVWLSEEYLEKDFALVFAAYLHELDHKSGGDHSATFSYALTDTLAEVVHAIITNPELGRKFSVISERWSGLQATNRASD